MEGADEEVTYAKVTELIGKTGKYAQFDYALIGSRGGVNQVKVTFIKDPTRSLVRNVKGPVRKGDILALMESEREAKRLK